MSIALAVEIAGLKSQMRQTSRDVARDPPSCSGGLGPSIAYYQGGDGLSPPLQNVGREPNRWIDHYALDG